MGRFGAVVILILMLAACGKINTGSTDHFGDNAVNNITVGEAQTNIELVSFTVDDITVQLDAPTGWAVNTTPHGVVLTEHIRSIASEGQLDGILVHIFLDPLEDVTVNVNGTDNLALQVLDQIASDTSYVGESSVTSPSSFTWDNHPAAYYLLHNPDDNVSLVLGVVAPQTSRLVTMIVSAPDNQAARIRELLPDLLGSLRVNDVMFDSTSLQSLPSPLQFPVP